VLLEAVARRTAERFSIDGHLERLRPILAGASGAEVAPAPAAGL